MPASSSSSDSNNTAQSSATCKAEKSPNNNNNIIPRILSGSLGSIITALAVTPLEVVKIRQQAAGAPHNNIPPTSFRGVKVSPCKLCGTLVLNNGLMDCVLPIESTPLRSSSSSATAANTISKSSGGGTFATLFSIARNEGYTGLYAGLRPTLIMSVPNTVLYFSVYDEISMRLRRNYVVQQQQQQQQYTMSTSSAACAASKLEDDAKKQPYIPLLAGSTARLLASLVTAPLELIRTRQASSKVAAPMMDEFRLLLRQNGISSLYVGLAPTLWRDVPFSAIYWLFLENFRNVLSESNELGVWSGQYYEQRGMTLPPSVEAMHAFVSGAAAGSFAAAFTTPFDVVKTRRQMVVTQAAETHIATTVTESCNHYGMKEYPKLLATFKGSGKYDLNTFQHMQRIIQQEGVTGLWKGNVTRIVKIAPACAIMISCYEFGKRVFGEVM